MHSNETRKWNVWLVRGLIITLIVPSTLPAQSRIEPDDLEYRGAFLLPLGPQGASRWGYGGRALTFYPDGDDGRGSLFGAGHPHGRLVGECSIPSPKISLKKNVRELPVARQLQPFGNIAGRFRPKLKTDGLDTFGGLAYLEGRLYWCYYRYYAVQPLGRIDHATHGRSRLTMDDPRAEGLWHVGPYGVSLFHQKRTANYMFAIPEHWAEEHVRGYRLATGKSNGPGNAAVSHGPALYAVDTPESAKENEALEAIVLLHYPAKGSHFPRWSECDKWEGAAWIEFAGKSAVVFAGSRGRGETYYGAARKGDCSQSKGYHCPPYEPEIVFYDPADLARVAAGDTAPHRVLPYAMQNPSEHLWVTCHYRLGGMAYDPQTGRLFLVQTNGERTLVHVWRIKRERLSS